MYCLAVQAGFYSYAVVFACHACGPGPIPGCNIGERVFILPVTCTCGLCLYVCDVCMHVCVNVCVWGGGGYTCGLCLYVCDVCVKCVWVGGCTCGLCLYVCDVCMHVCV